jgi:hypothetical protein
MFTLVSLSDSVNGTPAADSADLLPPLLVLLAVVLIVSVIRLLRQAMALLASLIATAVEIALVMLTSAFLVVAAGYAYAMTG